MPRSEDLLPNEEASEAVAVVASVVAVVASEVVAVILVEVTAEDSAPLAESDQTLQMIALRKK